MRERARTHTLSGLIDCMKKSLELKEHYFKLTFIIFTREITVHFGPDPNTIMFPEQRLLFFLSEVIQYENGKM